ncbi:ABC transporter substrate-binding protein [Spirochaeta africana]|uniref:ABC-type dipeptide transport system, periplasmic component n=1 Tax=Spirochaeta africana (strain ATCC 700263 / DSM 8902 / Z-7692) TaxID=889378 RepID=H9UML3_SPIAZ|nr:ABC transporter substrate-binding protein [Spirochaeta africana]AFG38756.1 ABC-type dipeptide transport system, periplasmic component [Spirochaeta africana DSM 8902]
MRLRLVGIGVVLAILLAGCGDQEVVDIEESGYGQFEGLVEVVYSEWEQGQPGGRFVFSVFGSDPRTFNTIVAAETSTTDVTDRLYARPVRRNQMTLEWEPWAAESWEISEDERTVTYTLREGMQWSDGEPVVASDFVDAVNEIYLDPVVETNYRNGLMPSGEPTVWETIDERTFSVTMPFVYAGIFNASYVPPLPMHIMRPIIEEQGVEAMNTIWGVDVDVTEVVGNGPFVLRSYDAGQRVVLERNEYYFEEDEWGTPLPYLDEVVIEFLPDQDTQLQRFLSGDHDFLHMRGEDVSIALDRKDDVGFEVYSVGPRASSNFIAFNQNPNGISEPELTWLSNKTFRQAMAHLVDRESMVNNIQFGYGYPQYSFVPVISPYYWEGAPEASFPYDLEAAGDLLDSIGYVDQNGDGWRQDPDGNRISLDFRTNAGNREREAIGEMYAQDAAEIGIELNFQPEDFNTMVGRLTSTFDWNLILIGLTGSVDPISGANVYPSRGNLHMIEPSQESPRREWEARVDEAWDYANNTTDEQQRIDGYRTIQEIWIEEVPWVHTTNAALVHAYRNEWGNIFPQPVNDYEWDGILHRIYQK